MMLTTMADELGCPAHGVENQRIVKEIQPLTREEFENVKQEFEEMSSTPDWVEERSPWDEKAS